MTADAADVAAPRHFAGGRYEVLRPLGRGGQKVVLLVRDTALERTCALAWFSTEGASRDELDRLRREARALAQVGSHPHVVSVFDLGEEQGRPFFVTEFLAGGDLGSTLAAAGGALPRARALRIARDIADALAFVHAHGIVHRDVKPANVWLDPEGRVRLGDFGLALAEGRSRMTAAGTILGTPAYMAPEQLRAAAVDGRADLYALGCVLYELLTGRAPFTGPTLAVIAQHLHAAPTRPSVLADSLPEPLEALVLALLAKSPEDRPASAAAVCVTLDALLAETPATRAPGPETTAAPAPAPSRDVPAGGAPTVEALGVATSAPPPVPSPASTAPALATTDATRATSPARPARAWAARGAAVVLGAALLAAAGVGVRRRLAHDAAPVRVGTAARATPASEPARVEPHRLAIVAAREPSAAVDGETAWAFAARVIESVDRYREFRPVSPAGLLGARLTELGGASIVPDEAMAVALARRVRADTVAALAVSEASPGEYSVAVHVFAAGDPSVGASSMRTRVRRAELDGEGTERLATLMLRALARHWGVAHWTSEMDAAAGGAMPFDAWQAYVRAEQYCTTGRYETCERVVREALARAPEHPLLLMELSCAVSYQDRDDPAIARMFDQASALRARLGSRHDTLVFDQGAQWFAGFRAVAHHDRAAARAAGQRIVEQNAELLREYGDPIAYMYSAGAMQYFLEDIPGARARYAEARRAGPGLYPAWYEEAELVRGDGHDPAQNAQAAALLGGFIACNPGSELVAAARADLTRWRLAPPDGPLSCPDGRTAVVPRGASPPATDPAGTTPADSP